MLFVLFSIPCSILPLMRLQCCKQIATGISENATQQLIKFNCLLRDLVDAARFSDALLLFRRIHSSHAGKPDHYSLSTALTACAHLHDSASGAQLHALSIRSGLKSFPHVANSLLSLYAKSRDLGSVKLTFGEMENPDVYSHTTLLSACAKLGEVDYALKVFDEMPQRDLALWNALITGCAESKRGVVFRLFSRMRRLGMRADHYTLASLLSLCSVEIYDFGKQVHSLVVKTGYLQKASVVNSLLTMYFNCGSAADAYGIFENMGCDVRNEITHNAMISGLVNMEQHEEALLMFKEMLAIGMNPTELTYVSVMGACFLAKLANQLHGQVVKRCFRDSTSVNNAAISMYSNCGDLNAVCLVFERLEEKDVVSWNAIMASFAQENMGEDTISAYLQMQRNGIQPDEFTVGSLLGIAEKLEFVEMIEAIVLKRALDLKVEVSNALLSAFSRIGEIEKATNIFQEMPFRNMISWNVMISGFLLNGLPVHGLQQFSKLLQFGLQPNHYTLGLVLSICASVSDLLHGKQIHAYVLKFGYFLHTLLGNSLITLYSKCGALNWSLRLFQNMVEKDTVSWNSIISAYSQYGEGKEAIQWFEAMRHSNTVEPDKATFTAVLSACSHSGLVAEGIRIFNLMVQDYGIEPEMHHFSCIVDLLGRAGFIDIAERLVEVRSVDIDPGVWWTLFSSCAAHGHLRLGSIVAEYLLATEKDDPAIFVLLSNLYANAGKWEESANVRESIKQCGVMKQPGRSWITS